MIHRLVLGGAGIAALITIGACDGPASPLSTAPSVSSAIAAREAPSLSQSSPRSGVLHATKACPDYHGNAGDFCSITSSNVAMIEPGSKVFYAKPLVDGSMVAYLQGCPSASVAGFSLSNIAEWLSDDQLDTLLGEVVRTAKPNHETRLCRTGPTLSILGEPAHSTFLCDPEGVGRVRHGLAVATE